MTFYATVSNEIHDYNQISNKILVLEDEPLIRDVLEAHLKRAGYVVFAVESIEEATEILETKNIGCIVSDVVLGERPCDNGIVFCKEQVRRGYKIQW